MDTLRFGTGGVPFSAKSRSVLSGIERIAELGLGCMEVEFVHVVRIQQAEAEEIGDLARKLDVRLSSHGPYYINLAALEKQKIGASRSRLIQTAQACQWMGADRFTFHAAFYQKQDTEDVYVIVKEQIEKMAVGMKDEKISSVSIRPELTGKPTQFGSLEELIRLSKELDNVWPCIDFAHAHARSGGELNGYDDFAEMLAKIKKGLGQKALHDLHIHMSGIAYTAKGERNHLPLEEADIDWRALMKVLHDFDARGLVICESPRLEEDAMLMKEFYEKI